MFISHNMANIFLVSHILLLFHSPKGSWNKSAKCAKLGIYWPYCTRNSAITNAYLCIIQETQSWCANYKMQNRIFQSSTKFVHGKNQKTKLLHLYLKLVETFAWVLNSKIVFKYLLWLKLLILKNKLHALNPLLTHTKKQAYSF